VIGRVTDADRSVAVVSVDVALVADDRIIAVTTTDSLGTFVLRGRDPGRYRVIARRLGYAESTHEIEALAAPDTIRIELAMTARPVEVPEVSLVVRDPYLVSNGFYERRKAGSGDFLTGEEIRRRNTASILDILRSMRNVKIQRIDWKSEVYVAGAGCLPQIVMDGVTVRYGGRRANNVQPLEDLVVGMHVEGIEVYRGGSGAPTAFVGPNAACGVILIWTRHR
jgi:hypothetical protein